MLASKQLGRGDQLAGNTSW